jgi:hypothetical protein
MESKHAHRNSRTNTTSATLNPKSISVFLDLLDLHDDVSSARRWQWDFVSAWTVVAIFTFDSAVKFFDQGIFAEFWWLSSILIFESSANVLSQIRVQGHHTKLQGSVVVHDVFIADTSKSTRNSFFKLRLFLLSAVGLFDNCFEAVLIEWALRCRAYLAMTLKQIDYDRASYLAIRLKEGYEIEVDVGVEGDAILGRSVKSGDGILENLLWELDCFERSKFICMYFLELCAELLEEVLGVERVTIHNHV